MATDIKKFLDQAGVSTLWSRVAEEVAKVDAKAVKNAEDIVAHGTRLDSAEAKIAALEAGTYDDTELRGLIGDNKAAHEANAAAIEVLNGAADVAGSVANTANAAAAAKVAEIVANADANFDTLKEIADWILNDTTGAADMANDIAALQGLVGDKAVATQIAEAISAEGLDKYALAADLTTLAGRVKVLEDAGYQNAEAVAAAVGTDPSNINDDGMGGLSVVWNERDDHFFDSGVIIYRTCALPDYYEYGETPDYICHAWYLDGGEYRKEDKYHAYYSKDGKFIILFSGWNLDGTHDSMMEFTISCKDLLETR
jgi:hypothetical protein